MKLIMLVFVAAFIVAEFVHGALGRSCRSGNGHDYTGKVSWGKPYQKEYGDRRECRNWLGSGTPYSPTALGADTWEEAKNYCRNPGNSKYGLMCFFNAQPPTSSHTSLAGAFCNKFVPRCTGPCRLGNGMGYLGNVATTSYGSTCKVWKDHDNNWTDKDFPDISKEAAKNYCRNLDNSTEGPWCYFGDTKVHWGYCTVPLCTCDCKSGNGVGYTGKEYKTKSFKECKNWSTHVSKVSDEKFPDGSAEEAARFCRNLDYDPDGPWCYYGDTEGDREHCDIPSCP